ncbi:hypothetical protein [Flavobacterium succinicans]|uniref:Lipoprotein n=1 Tax=Flavobacterium succinicans TaxID=29536 RepID=A0A199XR17_9FLAO|nr:hypothetical protein [Flavobacterium succinicans]OAZ04198.1 hypothetical protein FLB_11910 [Flavobacterium succinicans]
MRKVIFLMAILLLVSCKNENAQQPIESEGIPIEKSISKIISKRDFPIKNFSKIELVSYYNRVLWDTIKYKGERPSYKLLVDNYKLTFDSTMIQERVVLNKSQEKELLNLLISDTCVPKEIEAACYDPRHMILFRDKKNRIVGYNEFCISCIGSRSSKNLEGFQKYCYADMAELFRKFGIKLFVTFEDHQEETEFVKRKGLMNLN